MFKKNTTVSIALIVTALIHAPVYADDPPHAVFVVGTPHYSPAKTMPELARLLRGHGFRTTIVRAEHNPEKNEKGIPGLEALRDANVAIFFLRFLGFPDEQLKHITDYVESGRPVIGFRTSTHAFMYPQGHKFAHWNDGFGKNVLGSKYRIHLVGSTMVEPAKGARQHEILAGVDLTQPRKAAGTLYLSKLPDDATVLLRGTGRSKRTGTVTNAFGKHELKATMIDDVAWTWKNQWGGRVFTTTLGHPNTFKDPNWMRLFVNAIHWAAGKPVPSVEGQQEGEDAG